MQKPAYEASESLILQHERLLAQVPNLKHSLTNKTAADKHSLIESLRGWLVVHIETADKALAEYLHARAIPHSLGETP